jgi:hypothetical protein
MLADSVVEQTRTGGDLFRLGRLNKHADLLRSNFGSSVIVYIAGGFALSASHNFSTVIFHITMPDGAPGYCVLRRNSNGAHFGNKSRFILATLGSVAVTILTTTDAHIKGFFGG